MRREIETALIGDEHEQTSRPEKFSGEEEEQPSSATNDEDSSRPEILVRGKREQPSSRKKRLNTQHDFWGRKTRIANIAEERAK